MDGQRDYDDLGGSLGPRGFTSFQRLEGHLRRRIFGGFIVLIPLLATFLVLRLVVGYVDDFFRPLVSDTPLDVPGVGVALTVVLLYAIGVLVSAKAGRRAINWQDAVLSRVPVVKSIYGVAKQAADAVTSPMDHQFSRVVFLEWPRTGMVAMGLVTGSCVNPMSEQEDVLLAVYIPTVPNPTSGMMAFVRESDVVETDLSLEEAMKVVFSGGIVLPDKMKIEKNVDSSGLERR